MHANVGLKALGLGLGSLGSSSLPIAPTPLRTSRARSRMSTMERDMFL